MLLRASFYLELVDNVAHYKIQFFTKLGTLQPEAAVPIWSCHPTICMPTYFIFGVVFFLLQKASPVHKTHDLISIKVNDTHFAQRRIKMELTVNGLVQKTMHVFVVYDRYKWACIVVDHLLKPDYYFYVLGTYIKKACCNATTDMSCNHLSNDAYITYQLRWKRQNELLT